MKDLNCPVCGDHDSSILYRGEEDSAAGKASFCILRCGSCSHLFAFPLRPSQESDSAYEESRAVFLNDLKKTDNKIKKLKAPWRRFILREYLGYKRTPSGGILKYLCALFLSRFTSLNLLPFHKEGRILDVGCNNGLYLHLLKNLGWQVWGVEIDKNACRLAEELGINIFHGNLEDAGFPEAFFDVVRFNQVFEHIAVPKKAMKEAKRVLKKDGRIYISVPNARSLAFFLFKEKWLGPTGHVQGFSPCSMKRLCGDAGLKVKSMRFNSSKNLLSAGISHFFKSAGKDFFLESGFIRSVIIAPLSYVLNILRLSDTFTVEALVCNQDIPNENI